MLRPLADTLDERPHPAARAASRRILVVEDERQLTPSPSGRGLG